MRSKKILQVLGHLLSILLLIGLGIFLSFLFRIWIGYPTGSDAPSHIFRIEFIERFFPNYNWGHIWAGGMPLFLWYPSILYLAVALLHNLTSAPNGLLLAVVSLAAIIISSFGIYGVVWEVTKKGFLSFVSACLYLSTPSIWSIAFAGGLYSRNFSLPFLTLCLFFAVRFFNRLSKERFSKFDFILTVITLAIAVACHYFIGPAAFIVIFGLAIVFIKKFWQKILWIIKIFIPGILLSAFFTIPMIIMRSPSLHLIKGHGTYDPKFMFASWADIINDGIIFIRDRKWDDLWSLSPFLIPVIALLVIIVLLFKRKNLSYQKPAVKLFWLYLILAGLLFVYCKWDLPFFRKNYGAGVFDPRMALQVIPIFLAPLVGFLWHFLSTERKFWQYLSSVFLIGLFFWLPYRFIWNIDSTRISSYNPNIPLSQTLKEYLPDNQFNFRVGTGNYSNIASWFNSFYPYVSQTRDYLATSVVIPDDYFHLVVAAWQGETNIKETNFLFDWWAVKQFFVDPTEKVDTKFSQDKADYQYLTSDQFNVYQYNFPSPLLSSINTPSFLIVGSKISYDLIYRSLALGNLNSSYFIPVKGPEYIDDLDSVQLQKFPAIFLYNFKWKNKDKAQTILQDYQNSGGAIFIEENKEGWQSTQLNLTSVSAAEDVSFGKEWQLQLTNFGQEIIKKGDFDKFSPPIFDNGPWHMRQAQSLSEEDIVLKNFDQPVLAAETKGKGRVIWSGLNFPYHILSYRNEEEADVFGQLLSWLVGKNDLEPEAILKGEENELTYTTSSYIATFVNPQLWTVQLKEPAKGVLFKEAYFQNWQAFADGKRVKLYKAGPTFMYVPLEGREKEVKFVYKRSIFPEQISWWISVITLLCLCWWAIAKKIGSRLFERLGKIFSLKSQKIREKGQSWWDQEE